MSVVEELSKKLLNISCEFRINVVFLQAVLMRRCVCTMNKFINYYAQLCSGKMSVGWVKKQTKQWIL